MHPWVCLVVSICRMMLSFEPCIHIDDNSSLNMFELIDYRLMMCYRYCIVCCVPSCAYIHRWSIARLLSLSIINHLCKQYELSFVDVDVIFSFGSLCERIRLPSCTHRIKSLSYRIMYETKMTNTSCVYIWFDDVVIERIYRLHILYIFIDIDIVLLAVSSRIRSTMPVDL